MSNTYKITNREVAKKLVDIDCVSRVYLLFLIKARVLYYNFSEHLGEGRGFCAGNSTLAEIPKYVRKCCMIEGTVNTAIHCFTTKFQALLP